MKSYVKQNLIIGILLIFTPQVLADFDQIATEIISQNMEDPSFQCSQDINLDVCNVFAQFTAPSDLLLSVGFANITTNAVGGYYQAPTGSDTAPLEAFIPFFPELSCDSFITIGLKSVAQGVNNCTAPDPDFDTDLFNNSGQLVGGWFCSNPPSGQGLAGNYPDNRVLIAQLSVPPGSTIGGDLIVFFNDGSNPVTTSFSCFGLPPCVEDPAACDDGNDCTTDVCNPDDPDADANGCLHPLVPPGTMCESDGNPCTMDFCDPVGACSIQQPLDCSDGNSCTIDTCDPAVGCVNTPVDCNDDNACTTDSCFGGECFNDPISCDDGDPCTTDGCDPATGACINDAVDCNDNDACTDDSCDSAVGCLNTPIVCDDGDLCTTDSCDPATGCVFDFGDCDDGDPCTTDGCDPADGSCFNNPIDCDDGDACTMDACDPDANGECVNTPIICTDDDVCTDDSCDPLTGCVFTPVVCEDDGNICTDDVCDAVMGGCVNIPNSDPCDDADNCTTNDTCMGGSCAGEPVSCPGPAGACDGGQECDQATGGCVDVADPAAGTPCEADGDLCTLDSCDGAGTCVNIDTVVCQQPNPPCESGQACDPAQGICVDMPDAPAGTLCELDSDLCTFDECDGNGACMTVDQQQCLENEVCNPETGICELAQIPLFLDIDPGKCPNAFNRGSNGQIFVALVGTPENSVSDIDQSSLLISRTDGIGGTLPPQAPKNINDFATPFVGQMCGCHALGGDGVDDLRIRFKKNEMTTALLLDQLPTGSIVELQVTGQLLDGTAFVAIDCVILARNASQIP